MAILWNESRHGYQTRKRVIQVGVPNALVVEGGARILAQLVTTPLCTERAKQVEPQRRAGPIAVGVLIPPPLASEAQGEALAVPAPTEAVIAAPTLGTRRETPAEWA